MANVFNLSICEVYYEARSTNKFQTLCLKPRPTEGGGLSKSYCVVESTRELLRYYEQKVPRTCGADVRTRRAEVSTHREMKAKQNRAPDANLRT